MRIGLAQLNTTVGDLAGNRSRILHVYRILASQGADLVVFPEMVVCGYPPRDLLFKRQFVTDVEASLASIAAEVGEVPALIGTVESNPAPTGRRCFNSAVLCRAGKVEYSARKCLLPTYDVFDEDRYFEPAENPGVFLLGERRIGVTICEDIWTHPDISPQNRYHFDPVKWLADESIDLMINLSASPWNSGKGPARQTLVTDAACLLGCPVVYVNAVGGNDELVFDGRSLVADACGRVIAGLAGFREDARLVDVPAPTAETPTAPALDPTFEQAGMADIHDALVLGLRDYAHKSGFKRALVALSGGLDSAVVAVLAAEALGADNVIGVSLPSSISSQHSRDDARVLAANLGLRFETNEYRGGSRTALRHLDGASTC